MFDPLVCEKGYVSSFFFIPKESLGHTTSEIFRRILYIIYCRTTRNLIKCTGITSDLLSMTWDFLTVFQKNISLKLYVWKEIWICIFKWFLSIMWFIQVHWRLEDNIKDGENSHLGGQHINRIDRNPFPCGSKQKSNHWLQYSLRYPLSLSFLFYFWEQNAYVETLLTMDGCCDQQFHLRFTRFRQKILMSWIHASVLLFNQQKLETSTT